MILAAILILSVLQIMPGEMILETAKAQGPVDDQWPMFRHDMNRTGNSTSKAPNTNNILWTHQVPVTQYTWGYAGSPAVADGAVYQGGNRPDIMRSIDAITGIQNWQTPAGRVTDSPTVANDHVYFGDYGGNVNSLRVDTGAVEWRTGTGEWIDSSPVVYNGKVYIGTGIGDYVPSKPCRFYAFDEATGNIEWFFQAGGQIVASPTIVDNKVIFGSFDENIYALPVEDPDGSGEIEPGEIIWTFNVGARVLSSASVQDGVMYVGDLDGVLYALPVDDPNGDGTIDQDEVIWKFTIGNEIWSSPGISRGRVYVASHDHNIYALPKDDPNGDGVISSNEVIWTFETTDRIYSSPTIAGGKVFIGSEDYTLWALSEETGELIWNYEMPLQVIPYGSEYLYASASIVDGRVYVGNFDLTLYCFGIDDNTMPDVSSVVPTNNSVDVPLNANIEVDFDEDLVDELITDSSVLMYSSSGDFSTGKAVYNEATRRLTFNPDQDLLPNEMYTVRLISRYFQDDAGNWLDGNGNGALDSEPDDDYVWHFNTSTTVGQKPEVKDGDVWPSTGYVDTLFEFTVIYTDEDNDSPEGANGYVRIFIDGSPIGLGMEWANDTNTPHSRLLDKDYANGELFRFRTRLGTVGQHTFYAECSDGSNTNRTPDYVMPLVRNRPPSLDIPTQHAVEDQEHRLNLTAHTTDIDDDPLNITFTEDSEWCDVVDRDVLSCTFTQEGLLSDTVKVTAGDAFNNHVQYVPYIIDPVDDPPTLKPGITQLPQLTLQEGDPYTFDLGEYVTDPDTPMELLEVTDSSKYSNPVGMKVHLYYDVAVQGMNIQLSVSDNSSTLELELPVNIMATTEPDLPTELEEGASPVFWLLVGILVTIIVVLILLNVWMWRRRNEEEATDITNQGGDEK